MNANPDEREAIVAATMEALYEETVETPLFALRRLAASESWPLSKYERIYAAASTMLRQQHETICRAAIEAAVDRDLAARDATRH